MRASEQVRIGKPVKNLRGAPTIPASRKTTKISLCKEISVVHGAAQPSDGDGGKGENCVR
jgi:hypothetical protein